MTSAADLARMVPGFDFLQGLMKNAGAGLPSMGQWVAPTLNPEELDKRIQDLKTVHFWLDQNAKLIAATIQALEVQRMTLSTLQSMNLPLADLGNALKIKVPEATTAAGRNAGAAETPKAAPPSPKGKAQAKGTAGGGAPVDPLVWWGALTQQFSELAGRAFSEGAAGIARNPAAAAVKKSMDAAVEALGDKAPAGAKKVARKRAR